MKKKSRITNLLVVPLIASAMFLSSPTLASNTSGGTHLEIRNITNKGHNLPENRKGIVGTVRRVSGAMVFVENKDGTEYTIDATHATIMKAENEPEANPSLVNIADIKAGDSVVVRGTIKDTAPEDWL